MSDNSTTGVTREDVIWCFDRLFGRVVADHDIQHFVQTETDFRSLVTTLVSSAEHQRRFSSAPKVFADGFVYDVSISSQKLALQVLRLMKPQKVESFKKTRVGNAGDGGYIMLDDFDGIEAAYSLGINDDVSWDLEIARLGIDIYQYDHTIDRLPEENSRFHWFRTGIAGTKRDEFDTLPNLMVKNGHARSTELLLKCDIEGHEWEMLAGMTNAQLSKFRQIVIETHGWQFLAHPDVGPKIQQAILNVTATHQLVHVHANNNSAYAIVGGIAIPAVLELTLVRIKGKQFSRTDEVFPTALDQPCNSKVADYQLGNFHF